MQSAFGVEHGAISKAGPAQMVLPGMEKIAGAVKKPPKPAGLPGTNMRMGTPKMATNAATKNFGHARKGGAGILSATGSAFKAGVRAAPGTSAVAGAGLTATAGLGAGMALKPNN
jgi:hypothetical protein